MRRLPLFDGEEAESTHSVPTPKRYAPGTELAYDPGLPGILKQQHRDILAALERTLTAADASKYKLAGNLLLEFRRDYQRHLYEKNQRFLPYLNHCLARDGKHSKMILKISSVTRHLDHKIMAVVKTYEEKELGSVNRESFLKELGEIRTDLARHMREEDEFIFPMYMPPEAYRAN
ncbi:MAG: hemerythrin domain-containing protein [Bacillota bacterium]